VILMKVQAASMNTLWNYLDDWDEDHCINVCEAVRNPDVQAACETYTDFVHQCLVLGRLSIEELLSSAGCKEARALSIILGPQKCWQGLYEATNHRHEQYQYS
jgi:hypothetical protein